MCALDEYLELPYIRSVTSCRLLLDDALSSAARRLCSALRCELTTVDSGPSWPGQNRRVVQVDMPAFLYRTLEEFGTLSGTSVSALLRSWIQEYAGKSASEEGRKIHERCRLITEWQDQGFTGKEPDLKYFARRLAGV
jgi:hypothetical protein